MSVYKIFKDGELLHTVIHAAPETTYSSGVLGIVSNFSRYSDGKLSLYEGVRARNDVYEGSSSGIKIYPLDPVDTHTIDKVLYVSGSYPSTGSITFDVVHDDSRSDKKFRAINNLFEYYSRFNPDYTTSSLDYYSLFFAKSDLTASCPAVVFTGSGAEFSSVNGAFTVEANIKYIPQSTTVPATVYYCIASQGNRFKFYVDAHSGTLFFGDTGMSNATSSGTVPHGGWHHVAAVVSASDVTFYIDGAEAGTYPFTGSLYTTSSFLPVVGAETFASPSANPHDVPYNAFVNGFYGNIHEVRLWNTGRTRDQILSNLSKSLTAESGSASLLLYAKFTDGPLTSASLGNGVLSATFDSSATALTGVFTNFHETLPLPPIWQPNDNEWFVTEKKRINKKINHFAVIEIPSMFYGRQIATGSFRLELNTFNKHFNKNVIVDDGRGNIYLSGSSTRMLTGSEDRSGVMWRSIGNIFYTEGIVAITDPSMIDHWSPTSYTGSYGDYRGVGTSTYVFFENEQFMNLSFKGDQRIASKVFMCRAGPSELNGSNNPTYTRVTSEDYFGEKREIVRPMNTTYITSIGVYDSERKLVAVAKLAQPIRKREKDKLNIRLRMDF